MSIRDANVVIIEVGKTIVRAGIGLHDLLKTPTVVGFFFFELGDLLYISTGNPSPCWSEKKRFRRA